MLLILALLACGAPETAPAGGHAEHAEQAEHAHDEPGADAHGHAHGDEPATGGHAAHAHEAPESGLVLALDGDKPWKMDEHTRSVMAETATLLGSAKVVSVDDAHKLGATLQGQLDGLIKGCTMEGASHDQLHVFLMVWMPEVKALGATSDVEQGQASLAKLNEMLTAYQAHFE